ncbi:MAG TPA: Hsp20/alpha crystallin family protein [Rubricoccaceae bacterium]|nr:Hsp20/alpha crystallin family protein [Rubricoccaceae bacterium]
MNGLTRYNPVRELSLLRREMDRLFNDFFPVRQGEDPGTSVWMPRADLAETDDAWILSLDLPGIPAENVEVTVEGDTLTVSGERKASSEQQDGRFHRIERTYGRFLRTFQFDSPVDTDHVEASFEDGVLTVHVAKAEASKPRRIEIRGRTQTGGQKAAGDGHTTDARHVEVSEKEKAA